MLAALKTIYLEQQTDKMHHILNPGPLLNALSGISALVEQAREARDALSGCRFEPILRKANA